MKKLKIILKKYAVVLVLIMVVAIIVAGHFWSNRIRHDISDIEERINSKYSRVRRYSTEPEMAPSPELISRLQVNREVLRRNFEYARTSFSTKYPEPPEFTLYPALEYKEYIYFSKDRLLRQAERRNVSLPPLPFTTVGLLSEDQIESSSFQFEVLKDLINLTIDSGVAEIIDIRPGAVQSRDFFSVLPVELVLSATSNEIIRFFNHLEYRSSYFIIRELSIAPQNEHFFTLTATIESIIMAEN